MHEQTDSYDGYVIRGILANNQFGITSVSELTSLNSRFFDKVEYDELEKLIRSKNFLAIQSLPPNKSETKDFLDILFFKDQDQKEYIVTVYDSNELEQDPQIIDIFSV